MRRLGLGLGMALSFGAFGACGGDDEPGAEQHTPHPDASLVDGLVGDAGMDHSSGDGGADASDADTPFDGPAKLSETGLFTDMAKRTLAPDVMPFEVRYPVWHDGAPSNRFVYLPPGAQIDTSYMDVWSFPAGTKAWKEFYKDGKLVETRYLEKRAEGADGWLKVSYLWDEAKQDGAAAPGGVKNALGTTHDVPDSETCTQCHNGAGDVIIGVSAIQSSKEAGGGFLTTLASKNLLSHPPGKEFSMPGDGLVEDVLGYLHGNCGHCHNDTNWLAKIRTLRYKVPVDVATPEETPTYKTNINALMNHITLETTIGVVPGNPGKSQVYVRMGLRDDNGMPNFDTKEVDTAAVTMMETWINGLK